MANANAPMGLLPRRRVDGMTSNFQMRHYYMPASDANVIAVGDAVVKTAGLADTNGTPAITLASAGGYITGVVVGFAPAIGGFANGAAASKVRPASTAGYAIVCDDPEVLFEIQENDNYGGVASTPLPVAAVGKNANIVYAAPNTNFGVSGTMLDANSVATTAGLQLNIVEFEQRADVTPGALYGKVLVRINKHTELAGVAGI